MSERPDSDGLMQTVTAFHEQLAAQLPLPADLRSVSYASQDLIQWGGAFADALPSNLVSLMGNECSFAPTWIEPDGRFTDLAFAMYQFQLEGYDLEPTLRLDWTTTGSFSHEGGDGWVGLANFPGNRWDWLQLTGSAESPLYFDPATHISDTGVFYAVFLCQGTLKWQLRSIRVGGESSAPLAGLVANLDQGDPPLLVSFDASSSFDPDGGIIAKYEWDWEGDGVYDVDSGTGATQEHVYDTAGGYSATVRVTDDEDAAATGSANLKVGATHYAEGYVKTAGGTGIANVLMTFSNPGLLPAVSTDANGYWKRDLIPVGANYTVTPSKTNYAFSPTFRSFSIGNGDIGVATITGSTGSDDWAMQGHDPQHTGRSPYIGAQTKQMKWPPLAIYTSGSSPAIGLDGTVYTVGETTPGMGSLYAINPAYGTVTWICPFGIYYGESSPAVDTNGTIYVGSANGKLYAIDPSGNILSGNWPVNTGTSYNIYSSPTIANGKIYVASMDSSLSMTSKLFLLDSSGVPGLGWPINVSDLLLSSPAISPTGTVYFAAEKKLYAVYGNAAPVPGWPMTDPILDELFAPAIGAQGEVYVRSFYAGTVFGVSSNCVPLSGWPHLNPPIVSHARSTAAIGADGTVYMGCNDGKVYAIMQNGTPRTGWPFVTGAAAQGAPAYSPAIGADGIVYIGGNTKFYAIKPNGTQKWAYEMFPAAGGIFDHSPAIAADGTVYVHSTYYLYAFKDS